MRKPETLIILKTALNYRAYNNSKLCFRIYSRIGYDSFPTWLSILKTNTVKQWRFSFYFQDLKLLEFCSNFFEILYEAMSLNIYTLRVLHLIKQKTSALKIIFVCFSRIVTANLAVAMSLSTIYETFNDSTICLKEIGIVQSSLANKEDWANQCRYIWQLTAVWIQYNI